MKHLIGRIKVDRFMKLSGINFEVISDTKMWVNSLKIKLYYIPANHSGVWTTGCRTLDQGINDLDRSDVKLLFSKMAGDALIDKRRVWLKNIEILFYIN